MKQRLFASEEFTNRYLWDVLPDDSWKGKPCFIIGGGPSLCDFNWDLLKGKRTIGVNRAFEKFEPTIIFSMDLRFLNWINKDRYGSQVTKQFRESKAYKVWLATKIISLSQEIFVIPVKGSYQKGFTEFTHSMTGGLGHGNNSGYAALNLAAVLGASPIYLLGFDMKHEGFGMERKTHWHNGHPSFQEASTVAKFIPYFTMMARRASERGIKVINLSPDSALECFPKKRWQEVLH